MGEEEKVVLVVKCSPFFDTTKKYGTCPACAAVVIEPNEVSEVKCPNCDVDLTLEMEASVTEEEAPEEQPETTE